MGSGFKQFTASLLTASDVNNYLMEQSVMSFASTGARDATVTAPEDGMVAYIRSNDSSEGLYTYNGTSWRKGPGWNAPWGVAVAPVTNTSGPTFNSTTYADFTSLSLSPSLVANRRYRLVMQAIMDNPAGVTSIGQLRFYDNTNALQLNQANYLLGSGWTTTCHFEHIYTATATGTINFKVQGAVASAGQQFRAITGATYPAFFSIEDIGPSGAPV